MEQPADTWRIWVDWDNHVAALQPMAGFELLCFFSPESYQSNLRILTQNGFRFLNEV